MGETKWFLRVYYIFVLCLCLTVTFIFVSVTAQAFYTNVYVHQSIRVENFNNNRLQAYLVTPTKPPLKNCTERILVGALKVEKSEQSLTELEMKFDTVNMGGWEEPRDCLATQKVAIIIPFKDRETHLLVLLNQLIPILQRQQVYYRIFVIEQVGDDPFNRGKLLNVGFVQALKLFPFSCFVFHDVDLLPEDDRIHYNCAHSPQHSSVATDKFDYKLFYSTLFGGVEMFTRDHFKLINGFSNVFWGWGGEDDNLYHRLQWKGLKLHRQSVEIARYTMLDHQNNEFSTNANPQRHKLLETGTRYFAQDGLNSVHYRLVSITNQSLYTRVQVDLQRKDSPVYGMAYNRV